LINPPPVDEVTYLKYVQIYYPDQNPQRCNREFENTKKYAEALSKVAKKKNQMFFSSIYLQK